MKVRSLEEEQRKHEEEMREQREEYLLAFEELTIGLREAQKEIGDVKRSATKERASSRQFKSKNFSSEGSGTLYEFHESMWDAALLCFFKEISLVDKAVLLAGIVANHALQILWLVVVAYDMIENPYPESKVEQMLEWRVERGHSQAEFDQVKGLSKVELLCNKKLWSFEQEQYEEMYSYLYKPIAGWILSFLALVLWVMVTVKEYRGTVEQALAIHALPASAPGEHCILENDEGDIEIVGIRRPARVLALLFLSLPRLVVVCIISYVGCQYLAQTPSLADIVLNAVGLSFVLDIDELLHDVLCTQKIRTMMEHLKPLPCSDRRSFSCLGSLGFKDMIRYAVMLGMILFAYFRFLVPFHENVRGAASALCGGMYDFSYQGGTTSQATIWLHNSSDFSGTCNFQEYLKTYFSQYPVLLNGVNGALAAAIAGAADVDFGPIKQRVVLSYALKGCPPGEIMKPLQAEEDDASDQERQCVAMPPALISMLPGAMTSGTAFSPGRCQQFRPELFERNCLPLFDGESCLWTHGSKICDGDPPGTMRTVACTPASEVVARPDEAKKACAFWGFSGYAATPFINCRALQMCSPPNYNCFMVRGAVAVDYTNTSALDSPLELGAAAALIQSALESLPWASSAAVGASPVRRLKSGGQAATPAPTPPPTPAPPLAGQPWQAGPTTPPLPSGAMRAVFYYRLGPLPVSFVPEIFFAGNATGAILQSFANSSAGVVQVSFSNVSFLDQGTFVQEQMALGIISKRG